MFEFDADNIFKRNCMPDLCVFYSYALYEEICKIIDFINTECNDSVLVFSMFIKKINTFDNVFFKMLL